MQDLEAKIVVLGAQGVGKTSLLNRFIHNQFKEVQQPTIGANFLTKTFIIPDYPHITIRLQIWDTAGQERFRSISKLYYRGAHAALLCYDITDSNTFDQMGIWLQELQKHNGNTSPSTSSPEATILHVVGTKADVVAEDPRKRQVAFERCISYVAEHLQGAPPAPTSPPLGAPTSNLAYPSSNSLPTSTHYPSSARTASSSAGAHTPTSPPLAWDPSTAPASSKRHSGFWGQEDAGWGSCHEISSKDGEGVEEVFRVLTRKLVEQRLRAERRAELDAIARGGLEGADGSYFDYGNGNGMPGDGGVQSMDRGGSFRLGHGDKRRSWLGLGPVASVAGSYMGDANSVGGEDKAVYGRKASGRCC